jgi:hypothetical protein
MTVLRIDRALGADDPLDPLLGIRRQLSADRSRLARVKSIHLIDLDRHLSVVRHQRPQDLDALDRVAHAARGLCHLEHLHDMLRDALNALGHEVRADRADRQHPLVDRQVGPVPREP